MKSYVGIDLHSTNSYLCILDERGQELDSMRVNNDMSLISKKLEPYRSSIASISIESTYNWYWLVDGLMEQNYPVKLANPVAMKRYEGIKNTNDHTDASYLAELDRLGILPTGYIYPKEDRYPRDLFRTRMQLVRLQTLTLLSLQSMFTRHCNIQLSGPKIKKLTPEELQSYFSNVHEYKSARARLKILTSLREEIAEIEKDLETYLIKDKNYLLINTVPGVGKTLSKIILLETGNIERFKKVGCYASYCRCVQSIRISNGKKKGSNNRKNGNAYLHWAYLEAATCAIRSYPEITGYYQKRLKKTHRVSALNAIAHKLANAVFFMLRDGVPFDMKKLF